MVIPEDQGQELTTLCDEIRQSEERGIVFLPLIGMRLPNGCTPAKMDGLLCPTAYDGYPFRLFFAERVQSHLHLNWNTTGVRILERNWQFFSWKVSPQTRLIQMVAVFLRAFN